MFKFTYPWCHNPSLNWVTFSPDTGLLPIRYQAIIITNADSTDFSEKNIETIFIDENVLKVTTSVKKISKLFSLTKMYLKLPSEFCRQFLTGDGLSVL